jgi:hypothetical protein
MYFSIKSIHVMVRSFALAALVPTPKQEMRLC